MKQLLLAISMMVFGTAFAQKMPSDYFDEASKLFEAKKYNKSLPLFQYIVDHYQRDELYPMAYFNTGVIYNLEKRYNKAIIVFNGILKSSFNEKQPVGGGIMAGPFANYRHNASEILSDIYYDKKMFDSALHYFALSDTVYRFSHFCGNAYASNHVHTALRYADIYQKLNRTGKSIESLLPAVFITFADNSKVIDELKKLFANQKYLKKVLDESLTKIYPKEIRKRDDVYTMYYFKFLNTEITVPNGYEDDETKFDKEHAIKEIRQTKFYKMIENL
jgi:tetratricopeptide (TPR) repeat protein